LGLLKFSCSPVEQFQVDLPDNCFTEDEARDIQVKAKNN